MPTVCPVDSTFPPDGLAASPRDQLQARYALSTRATVLGLAMLGGLLVAGFWNARLADGFGRNIVAGQTIGDSRALSGAFAERGFGFGFLFAAVAGLAATFTACNCVVFAMLPGLAATGSVGRRRPALSALGVFAASVMVVGALYGTFIGFLGPEGIQAFNSRAVRSAQASTIFSTIGVLMLLWGSLELGFFESIRRRVSPEARAFFSQPTTKAGLLGLLVGAFAIGRPFPVMRDFLVYAATAHNPFYGAAVMMIQGLGQITAMVILLLVLVYGFGARLTRWVTTRPHQVALVTAVALVAGGSFFIYYWGLAPAFDIGRWGFRLGWY
jgi:sulfite exporter TauE/SafE